ncbi:F-box/LRR-repeat protein, putative [Entamoeba invadens IP1]|uniref:F-box/LRR-repeat protein, putative n=1 Tax=Entamoeba invadens IP1 TaxID=370355 RepID=A0A0A1U1W9_ENTIV|nr:F-box/LRR-repeat protein, putative [Entamoeba invadens IP1]ELP88028.1 F-box/LRR-repeat protein, putative [Entamoeba invadens IP1]|eukprot:XP_004254799.1 F-box/LRR-repeat protein, putative [Entamoeba invadens IP1]
METEPSSFSLFNTSRAKQSSLNFPSRPFLLSQSTTSLIPSLTEIVLDSVERFAGDFAMNQPHTPITLPPILATRLIQRVSNNPNATEQDLNLVLFRIFVGGTRLTNFDIHSTHLLTKVTCLNIFQLCQNAQITTLDISNANCSAPESLAVMFTSFKYLRFLNTDSCVAFDDNCLFNLISIRPPLEILSVSNCPKITDKSISELKNIHTLQSFKGNHLNLNFQSFCALHNLKEIEIFGCQNLDDFALEKISKNNPKLAFVSFGNGRLSDLAIQKCVQRLSANVEHINLSGCSRAGPLTLAQLFDSQFKLKYLNLAGCFGMNGDIIMETYHPMFRSNLFRWLENLKYLNIAACVQFSNEFISTILTSAPQISTLILDDTLIADNALEEFIKETIVYNETIRRSLHTPGMKIHPLSLSLKRCTKISDNALATLFKSRGTDLISINLSSSPTLSTLSLAVLSLNSNALKSFYAANNDLITENSWIKFVGNCRELSAVFLGNNRGVTNLVLSQICVSCPQISHLDVSGCLNLNQGAADILANMKSLQYLDISFDVAIGEDGIRKIANSLQRLSNFAIQGIEISRAYIFVQQAQCLNTLKLNFSQNCSDDLLRNIGAYCPFLSQIELRMCTSITDNGVNILIQKCSKVGHITLGGTSVTKFKMIQLANLGLFVS